MTKTEKCMIGAILILVCLMGVSVYFLAVSIEDAGGIKGIAVEAGKGIKDISREIEKH